MSVKNQTFFNKVVKHLFEQNRKSMWKDGICAYRHDEGMSCAIGCAIPKKAYDPNMEGQDVSELLEGYPDLERYMPANLDLANDLQIVHDDAVVTNKKIFDRRELAKHLCDVAVRYGLALPESAYRMLPKYLKARVTVA